MMNAVTCMLALAHVVVCCNAAEESKVRVISDVEDVELAPNARMQDQILRTYKALRHGDQTNASNLFQELNALKKIAKATGANREEMVRQLAIFATSLDGEEVLAVRWMLESLEIDDAPIIRAFAPHVDAEDPGLRSFVRDWFQYHDGASRWSPNRPLEPLNFSKYGDYIRNRIRKDEAIPKPFVEYVYSREPGHALLVFFYAYEGRPPMRRDILWSEYIVRNAIWMKANGFDEAFDKSRSQAIEVLQQLSKHEEWWVRLYVAEIMGHPDLQVAAILDRLSNDVNEIVRNAATIKLR